MVPKIQYLRIILDFDILSEEQIDELTANIGQFTTGLKNYTNNLINIYVDYAESNWSMIPSSWHPSLNAS